jgi:protein-tyrosine kinase
MESIRRAVERARAATGSPRSQVAENVVAPRRRADPGAATPAERGPQPDHTELNLALPHLQAKRIIAYNGADVRSRPYDMLRTQVLQSMGVGGWKTLGITSPTPGCGKTLTALNLAFSIARQPEQSVVLIDLDLQRPQVANSLGLTPAGGGVLDVLEERTTLAKIAQPVRAGNQSFIAVPTAATRESSELMGSRAMRTLLQDLRRNYQSHTIIVDLPPILSSDDVIAILPQIDCVLLVAAVGHSKASEVEECNRHLKSSHLVRVVVNKAIEENSHYYYY